MDILMVGFVGGVVALEVGIVERYVVETFELYLLFWLFLLLFGLVLVQLRFLDHIIIISLFFTNNFISLSMIDSNTLLKRLRVSSTINPLS